MFVNEHIILFLDIKHILTQLFVMQFEVCGVHFFKFNLRSQVEKKVLFTKLNVQ